MVLRFQFQMNSLAVVMGGHVRVGLEDNLYYDTGKTEHATNAGLIERIVKLARSAGREVASPDEAREIIGLPVGALRGGD
jgi:3-keto-5-aminohexanoate cleavage enzyme